VRTHCPSLHGLCYPCSCALMEDVVEKLGVYRHHLRFGEDHHPRVPKLQVCDRRSWNEVDGIRLPRRERD
jgi:hypothetical protein